MVGKKGEMLSGKKPLGGFNKFYLANETALGTEGVEGVIFL